MGISKPPRNITQRDVARALKLTQATVSLALRGDRTIPKARRAEILKAAKGMGYQPNPMGVGLAEFRHSSKTVPVRAVLAWINYWPNPEKLRGFAEFELYWQGAFMAAEKMGYRLEEFACHERLTPDRLEKILKARGINGILIPPHPVQPAWGNFRWERFSSLRFGRSVITPQTHVVTSDHVANTLMAVDAVRQRGYKRIGLVGDTAVTDRRWLFEAGFLRAQLEMNERDRLPLFAVDRQNPYARQTKLTSWLKKYKPDAVLSSFQQLPDMVKNSGYRIPEDIGMAAMSILDGKLDAGVYQNPEEIGRVAVLMLVSLIHDNARGIPSINRELLVKGKWVDGSMLPRRRWAS